MSENRNANCGCFKAPYLKHTLRLDEHRGKMVFNNGRFDVFIEIKFCPFCGKKITKRRLKNE